MIIARCRDCFSFFRDTTYYQLVFFFFQVTFRTIRRIFRSPLLSWSSLKPSPIYPVFLESQNPKLIVFRFAIKESDKKRKKRRVIDYNVREREREREREISRQRREIVLWPRCNLSSWIDGRAVSRGCNWLEAKSIGKPLTHQPG